MTFIARDVQWLISTHRVAFSGACSLTCDPSAHLGCAAGVGGSGSLAVTPIKIPLNPLTIFGSEDTYGGWAAHSYVTGPTDSATDLSDRGRPLVQSDGPHKPAIVAGPNGKPAWSFARLGSTDGPRLVGSGFNTTLAVGSDFAMWFVAAKAATCLNTARPFTLEDDNPSPGVLSTIGIPRADLTKFACQNSAPSSGGFTGNRVPGPIDQSDTNVHFHGWFRHPTTGFWTTWGDGTYGSASTDGSVSNLEMNVVTLGHPSTLAGFVPFDGLIYEAWITKRPTADQVAAMHFWSQLNYGTP